jgi:predicted RNase H-like HicB family nuclease
MPHKATSVPMEFHVVLERDETGAYTATVPRLKGCVSWGATKEEALRNVREAIELYLEVRPPPSADAVSIALVTVEG